ncbi:hypothetical protein GALL_533440 [mine drainage metagenome]|uniref:Uncharacterized protein n=1 Tax=mine drainage metagenome TaxID=410659 RepID=A0A1J5PIJ7_9ZZZZ
MAGGRIREIPQLLQHLADGCDATDGGILLELDARAEGSDEFPVYITGTAAHAFQDARLGERAAAGLDHDAAPAWVGIALNAHHLELEALDLVSVEYGFPVPLHAGLDVRQGHGRGGGGLGMEREKQRQGEYGQSHAEPSGRMKPSRFHAGESAYLALAACVTSGCPG